MEIPYLYNVKIGQLTPSPSIFTVEFPSDMICYLTEIGGPPPPLSLHGKDREFPSNFDVVSNKRTSMHLLSVTM